MYINNVSLLRDNCKYNSLIKYNKLKCQNKINNHILICSNCVVICIYRYISLSVPLLPSDRCIVYTQQRFQPK